MEKPADKREKGTGEAPDMADEAADSLEQLVAQMRENARTARLYNAAAEAKAVAA